MPTKLTATVLAEGVSVDALTGRLTLFNALNHIYAAGFPALLHKLMVATQYERSREVDHFRERVAIMTPQGKVLGESVAELMFEARSDDQPPAHWSLHALWKIRFDEPGDYALSVWRQSRGEQSWQPLATCTLWVQDSPHPLSPSDEEVRGTQAPPSERAE